MTTNDSTKAQGVVGDDSAKARTGARALKTGLRAGGLLPGVVSPGIATGIGVVASLLP